ncbi:LysR family transcriptional regulator [Paraburkholderia tropica]|uniref:LysR family transcriptional regulator n=1 Tax=Paraburkholderia tropica TaxID=92647 RepID=UPI002AB2B4A4|nr:LysR family transcriptional regulator [Paraburkholderia tropica]
MNQLNAMRVFARVVDAGSFNVAGKQLGISPAAVTRCVGMLEAHLNLRLLNRTTRSSSLTEAGKIYLDGCRTIIEKLDELESELIRATRDPSGTLRIAAPSSFASKELPRVLSSYRLSNPRVDFDVSTFDSQIDFIEGGYDVCFASDRHAINANLVSRVLTCERVLLVASPRWIAANAVLEHPSQLSSMEMLLTNDTPTTLTLSQNECAHRVNVHGVITSSSSAVVRAATLMALGVAVLPESCITDDLASGALLPVLNRYTVNGGGNNISIVYPGRNYLSMKVRAFIDFTVDAFRTPASNGSPSRNSRAA